MRGACGSAAATDRQSACVGVRCISAIGMLGYGMRRVGGVDCCYLNVRAGAPGPHTKNSLPFESAVRLYC